MTAEERATEYQAYAAFGRDPLVQPAVLGGDALHPISTATTVRVRNGTLVTTHGPFAETKEHLGGFYLLEAETLDDAIAIAAKIPTVHTGSVELRPIMEFS